MSRNLKVSLSLILGTPTAMSVAAAWLAPNHRLSAASVAFVLGLVIGFGIASILEDEIRTEAAQAKARGEQAQIENKIGKKAVNTVDIALLNMRKLDEYYNLNKQQAKRSFNSSIVAVVVGFATIVLSVLFVKDNNAKFASALGGILGQFIGACFFYLYNKSLNQLNLFYGKLISLQNTMLALQICEKLTTSREDTMKTIALELMERKEAITSDSGVKRSRRSKQSDVHSSARARTAAENSSSRQGADESMVVDQVA